MIINTVKINNSKLTQGRYYWFKILKTLELSKTKSYYVLEDPLGFKILLPKDYYVQYNLTPGKKVMCRVDKINCKGQMFIEPMHPHYKEGNIYPFGFVEEKEKLNFFDEKEYIIVVKDVFDNKWEVKTVPDNNKTGPSEVECYIERIKKGMLYLQKANAGTISATLKPGEIYDFKIVDEKTNPENKKKYFILEDQKHYKKHPLQKKNYLNYRFRKGQIIKCRVDRLRSEGYYYLEPAHPYYKTGEKYKFPVIRLDHFVFANDKHQYILVLEDVFGEEVTIDMGENKKSLSKDKEYYECMVKDVHKGKPVLHIT